VALALASTPLSPSPTTHIPQCYSPLNIIDLFSKEVVSVDCDRFQTPFAFIFLYDRLTFLAFRKTEVVLWDLNGELLTRFEDHTLWFPAAAEDHTSVIYITEKQDLVKAQGRGGGGLASEIVSPHWRIS
jgi:hypothetical protein